MPKPVTEEMLFSSAFFRRFAEIPEPERASPREPSQLVFRFTSVAQQPFTPTPFMPRRPLARSQRDRVTVYVSAG